MSLNKKKCLCIHQGFKWVISYNVVKKMSKWANSLLSCTLSTLWKNKEAFVSEFENSFTANNKMRKCDLSNIGQALLVWFKSSEECWFPHQQPHFHCTGKKYWFIKYLWPFIRLLLNFSRCVYVCIFINMWNIFYLWHLLTIVYFTFTILHMEVFMFLDIMNTSYIKKNNPVICDSL